MTNTKRTTFIVVFFLQKKTTYIRRKTIEDDDNYIKRDTHRNRRVNNDTSSIVQISNGSHYDAWRDVERYSKRDTGRKNDVFCEDNDDTESKRSVNNNYKNNSDDELVRESSITILLVIPFR